MRCRAVVVAGVVVGLLGVVEVPVVLAQESPVEAGRDVLLDGEKGLGGTAPGLKSGGRDFGGEFTTPESKVGVTRPAVLSEADAKGEGKASGLAPVDFSKQGSGPKSKRVEEVVSLRTEGSESFRLEDGSMVTDILSVPKWFKDPKGEWARVDPRVVADPAREGWLTNAGASWDVSFGPSAAGLEFLVDGIALGSRLVGVADVLPVADEKDPQVVWYRGVWPGVDVSYRVSESAVKETFVVKDRESLRAAGSFESVWSSPGRLVPSVEMPGGLAIDFDGDGKAPVEMGTTMVRFDPIYVFSARGELLEGAKGAFAVDWKAEEAREVGSLKDSVERPLGMALDPEFVESVPDDAFPLLVDPATNINPSTNSGFWYSSNQAGNYTVGTSQWPLLGNWRIYNTDDEWRFGVYFNYSSLWAGGLNGFAAGLVDGGWV